jgi:tRNA-dihydrouridine synthase
MIGRAAIGNPWIFREIKHYLATGEHLAPPTMDERFELCAEHLRASVEHHGERKGVIMMKKQYGNYLKNLPGGKQLRIELMQFEESGPILERLLNGVPQF